MRTNLLIVFVFLMLAGCNSVPPSREALKTMRPCCQSYSQLSFQPLTVGNQISISINEAAPVFTFQEGNSYVAAFSLPKRDSGGQLELKTYLSGARLPSATVYMPQFAILDSKKDLLRVVRDYQMAQDSDFFKGPYFKASITIEADDAYIVIYAAATKFGQAITYHNQASGYAYSTGAAVVFVPDRNSYYQIPLVPGGKLELTLN